MNFSGINGHLEQLCSTEIDKEMRELQESILRGHTDMVHDMRFIAESDVLLFVCSDKDMRACRLNHYICAAVYR